MDQHILNLYRLTNQVAIITGGGGALGGALAMGLSQAGARVVLLGRTAATLDTEAARINEAGGQALALVADVLDEEQLRHVQEEVIAEWGRIDILLNVAGGNRAGATIGPDQDFFDLSIADYQKVVDLNLKGTLLPTYVFAESMAERGTGAILNISSITAQKPFTRVVGYNMAKAGIDNFTKWLAVEMAAKFGEGLRVNAIAPGVFLGEQNRRLLYDEAGQPTPRAQTIIDHTPMKRFAQPEELVGAAVWLCSPAAAFVTGIIVPVDGGFSAFSGV
ncbi:MAG: SDR family oxidoreductase [Lewinella sp.]|nr:SDR family oxidoreductase [Lewinella sp.]